MTRKIIDIGQKGNDGTGDSLRDSFRKINDNFQELYSVTGLGSALQFTGLVDTPDSYVGQDNNIVSVNNNGSGITFKRLIGGQGVTFDYITNPNEIRIDAAFSSIQADTKPQLGGPLSTFSGGERFPIGSLPDLNSNSEVVDAVAKLTTKYDSEMASAGRLAANKSYVDTKLSLAGTDSVDTASGLPNPSQGYMTGPLILSRDPVATDNTDYNGLIAATKRYVDNSSYYSKVNLYVSTSGQDHREDLSIDQQGRALAYAFRTVEAAAKRAEEIILEAPLELGPYRKRLTYNEGASDCYLAEIVTSPLSGTGCIAEPIMTVDTIKINNAGSDYLPGDLIQITGGTGTSIVLEVVTSVQGTGAIDRFKVNVTGNYTVLPGSTNLVTNSNSFAGVGATFDVTYKLASITVSNGGSDFNLVSVRITGGGGKGAFGEAYVSGGSVTGITLTAEGSGYTSLPTITVELPRLKIFTNDLGTDYTQSSGPSRDIREGLFLKGETSGALANILAHNGERDADGNELFDIDIVEGAFEIGEKIQYGDPIKRVNVTIIMETGTYEENFPIKCPPNVSIMGDEFRRTNIRPRKGMSTSPWAGIHFCRDTEIDGLTVTTQRYGHHYLTDASQPIYPLINNAGNNKWAAELLKLNRAFIQAETIAWITAQVNGNISPFTDEFTYNEDLCKRDVGLLIDAMVFDLKWGGHNRTVSAALKYYLGTTDLGNSLIAITTQKDETIAAINRVNTIAQAVITNAPPAVVFSTEEQIINPAIVAESGSGAIITSLFSIVTTMLTNDTSFNHPKDNDEMDVFLMNDATRLYQMTIQGAGGFALVLDPEGQILTKSPYAQVGTVFSKSTGRQLFAGSLLIDGFAGNQQFAPISKIDNYTINVGELTRKPQTPFSFFRNGVSYRVNFIRNYSYSPSGSTAQFVLDETTPYTGDLFISYNESKCYRDVGLIVESVLADLVFGTNYQSVRAGLSYRRSYTNVVIEDQIYETVTAINYARDKVLELVTDPSSRTLISSRFSTIVSLLQRGEAATPVIIYPNTVNAVSGVANAAVLLQSNRNFIKEEIIAWIKDNYFVYNSDVQATCERDLEYIINATAYDVALGTNYNAVTAGLAYTRDNSAYVLSEQKTQTAQAIAHAQTLAKAAVSDATGKSRVDTAFNEVIDILNNGSGSANALTFPSPTGVNQDLVDAKDQLQANRSFIQAEIAAWLENVANGYSTIWSGLSTAQKNKCTRDVGYIVDALSYDILYGGNSATIRAADAYFVGTAAQLGTGTEDATAAAYGRLKTIVDEIVREVLVTKSPTNAATQNTANGPATATEGTTLKNLVQIIIDVINDGDLSGLPTVTYPSVSWAAAGLQTAVTELTAAKTTIQTSTSAWIISDLNAFVYDSTACSRDVGYIVDALTFDLLYGGNKSTVESALAYWNGVSSVVTGQITQSAAAFTRLKAVVQAVVVNTTVTPSTKNTVSQIKDLVNPGSAGSATTLGTLADYVIAIVQNAASAPGSTTDATYSASTYTTFKDVRNTVLSSKTIIQQATIDQINNVIGKYELVTPGNRSMLSNDFTCVNDMGYGLLATNGGLTEAVSMFTYYCYTAYYSLNGAQIRSVGGSCANGVYALKAEGSDPLEIPDIVSLSDNVSQGATVYAPGGIAPYQTAAESLFIYVTYDDYVPYNQSEIEIDHAGTITRYLINSADVGNPVPAGVAKLNLSTTGANNTSTKGLIAPVDHGTRVTIRSIFEFKLEGVTTVIGTRPSTALVFVENPDKVYRILSGTTGGLLPEQAKFTLRENYDFIDALVYDLGGPEQPADHGDVGDTKIAVNSFSPTESLRAVGSQFCWKGTLHTITAYEDQTATGQSYARMSFTPALVDAVTGYTDQVVLKCGPQAGMSGDITSAISTARFTGHDLLDIGTGSYADTNYPSVIYGGPANPKRPENEVQEVGKGRVFYVTTDQDGNFRVGPYFQVDQGTGTVTFAASIALSSLDGLGFKRGVAISEFSTDDTMTDNATDTVPVEQAVRAYIDRRLGQNHNGGILDPADVIPSLTGGYLALDGTLPMKATLDAGGHSVGNLADPTYALDAVTKQWHTINNLQDGVLTSPADASLLTFTGTGTSFVNGSITGDIGLTRSGNTLTAAITAGAIVNADVNASAAIAQSKLALSASPTAASAPISFVQANQGVSSFNSVEFNSTYGWVSLKTNGIALDKIVQLAGRYLIGNSSITAASPSAVAYSDVINLGAGVKKSQYSATGYLKRTNAGDYTADASFSIVDDSSGNVANTLVKRDADGNFSANIANFQELRVDSKTAVDTTVLSGTDTGTVNIYSYRGVASILLGDGAVSGDKKTYYRNNEHVFQNADGVSQGTINTGVLTTGASSTGGSLIGAWALSSGSTLDALSGTLKSATLTTGSATTAGTLTGAWTLASNSSITFGTGTFDITSGTLRSRTLSTGATSTTGSVVGAWTVGASSTFVATSVQNQANSATTTAATANTAGTIVLRDSSGNFSAGTITAALSGNASTASKWASARTVTFTGDVTGSFSIDGSADVSNVALTVGNNTVTLGVDTTGAYASSIIVSGSGISATSTNADDATAYTITLSSATANTGSTLVYRDASGNFSAGTITAALSGNASTATTATNANNIAVADVSSSSSLYYVTFVDGVSGNRAPKIATGITWTPSTNTLSVGSGSGTFSGNLTGNATSATTASGLNTGSGYQLGSLGVGTAPSATTGEIRATNNITAYYSDERLKTKLGKIENALDKVDQLSGFYYEANQTAVDLGYDVKREVGVSAQEVQAVMPEIVAPAPIDDKYLTVRYEKLAPLLIEAIKELRAEINDIKKKLG